LQDPWCYFGDPSHRARVVRDVVAAGIQVRERNLHVSSEGSKISRRHWNCPDETPAALRRATQGRQVGTILVERKSFEISAAASEQVDGRCKRFHSLKLSHCFSLKSMCRMRNPASVARLSAMRAGIHLHSLLAARMGREMGSAPGRGAPTLEAAIFMMFRSFDGISIYGVAVPWQQWLRKCTALALPSRAGICERETVNSASRALSPQDPQKPDEP